MKINELKVTALPQGSEVKGSSIASPSGIGGSRTSNEPKMDLEFKTDIKPVHTDTDPDYRREIAPDGIPQDIYNQLRNKSQERKPESEWNLPSKDEKPNRYIEKLKDLGGWYLDSVIDAGKSIGRGVKDQVTGLKDFGKRRWNTFKQDVVNDDVNRMRKLAGLNEKDEMEDVWAYSPEGESGIVARVLKTDLGFQVFVLGPYGWIAQGQPHMSQEEAQDDAMSFFEAIDTLDVDKLNEEQFLEVVSVLELHDEALTEEQLNEIWPAVAAGVGAGLGMWGIEQASKPKEEQTWYKLWKKFGPKKKVEKEVVAKESEELNEVLPLVVGGAAALGAGYAGYKWLKGLKDKVKDRKDTHKSKIDQALKDSVEPQPWWNDMDSTLQEMKADMLSISKKK